MSARTPRQFALRLLTASGYAGAAVSALLAVVLAVMWVRSYRVGDAVSVRTVAPAGPVGGGSPGLGRIVYFGSYRGRLQVCGFPSPATQRFIWHTPGLPGAAIIRHAQAADHTVGVFTFSVGRAARVFGFVVPYWVAGLACLAWPASFLVLRRRLRARDARGFQLRAGEDEP